MAHMPWTDQEIKILKELAGREKNAREVALVLKSRTVEAISAKGYALGLSFEKSPEIDMDAYRAMMKVVKA